MDDRTLLASPTGAESTVQINRTEAMSPSGDFGQKTQMGIALTCPVCETQNSPGETWCGECGFRLDTTPGETPSTVSLQPPAQLVGSGGLSFSLRPGVNTLGRQGTDILLTDTSVSRRHAQITVSAKSVQVEDLGSSNGTLVNNARLEPNAPQPLQEGDEIRFGSVILSLLLNPDATFPASGAERTVNINANRTEAITVTPETLALEEADSSSLLAADGPRLALESGEIFPLRTGSTTVGRRAGNDIVVADSYTSGSHAEIHWDGTALHVVDLGSTNGTQLNGARLPPNASTLIQEGDEIIFGQTKASVKLPVHDAIHEGSV